MARPDPEGVKRVAVVGAGVIGSGWAASFLARGLTVAAYDPDPGAGVRLRAAVDRAWPALVRLGLDPNADPGQLVVYDSLAGALEGAEFVQESAPEREDLKTELLAEIDRLTTTDVVIASSSSGLLPSRIQSAASDPGRIVIGHPFNPVYLLPLVEVLGGAQSDPVVLDWAMDFYDWLGKRPLRVRREVPGYIADRLQEAMWREALHMIDEGVASTEEIDAAITGGPGLRWAFMGPCLTHHMAGGKAGMAHTLEQFGPALKLPWTKLVAPELNATLAERLIAGTAAQADGRSVETLERERDEVLLGLLGYLETAPVPGRRSSGHGLVAAYEGQTLPRWQAGDDLAIPLTLHRADVQRAWVDYNGHMSESCYLLVFGDASDALFRYVGIDEAYRAAGKSLYTVETHINNIRELSLGEPLRVTTRVLDLDAKRVQIFHAMEHGEDGGLVATAEQMLLHVDMTGPRTVPIEGSVFEALKAIHAADASLPRPAQAGRAIAIRRPA